ncbi:MAG: GntR family transcriptional regulator [Alphaproteobacteria bacterium]
MAELRNSGEQPPPMAQISSPGDVVRDRTMERFKRIYTDIRDRICTNRYRPGTVLNETELAGEFGVSRTPIRRVLQKLNHDGLVETRNGVGTFVTDVDTRTCEELYRLRMKLAELIGELSPSVDPAAHIPTFERLLAQASRLGPEPDYDAIGQMNVAVTKALQELIQSEPLKELTALLYFRTARIWHKTMPFLDWAEEAMLVTSELKEILRALRMGDIDGVGFVRRNFIAMAFARLKRSARAA